MKKSVYLFMLILLIKSVYAYSDIQSFFTQNIINIDFILLTIIFTAVIKLTLKGKFGEDGIANLLYLTLGIALSSASVFYGNLSVYTLGMWILDLNQYIVLGVLIIFVILLYKAIPPWGPFNYWILRVLFSIFVVIFFSEKINPGFVGGILGRYTNLSGDLQIWITIGLVILISWGIISLLKFLRTFLLGEDSSGENRLWRSTKSFGRGLWGGTKWVGKGVGGLASKGVEVIKERKERIKRENEDKKEKIISGYNILIEKVRDGDYAPDIKRVRIGKLRLRMERELSDVDNQAKLQFNYLDELKKKNEIMIASRKRQLLGSLQALESTEKDIKKKIEQDKSLADELRGSGSSREYARIKERINDLERQLTKVRSGKKEFKKELE